MQEYAESDVRNTCPCDQSFWNSPCLDTNADWKECWIWSICPVWDFKHAGEQVPCVIVFGPCVCSESFTGCFSFLPFPQCLLAIHLSISLLTEVYQLSLLVLSSSTNSKGSSVSTYPFLHRPQLLLLKSPGLANHVGGKSLGPKFSHAVFGSLIVMCNPPEFHKLFRSLQIMEQTHDNQGM